jgi:hypothetical protein
MVGFFQAADVLIDAARFRALDAGSGKRWAKPVGIACLKALLHYYIVHVQMEFLYVTTPRTGTRFLTFLFQDVENAYCWRRQMIAGVSGIESCSR